MALRHNRLFFVFLQVGLDFTFESREPIHIFDRLINFVLQLIVVEDRCLVATEVVIRISTREVKTPKSPSMLSLTASRLRIVFTDPVGMVWGQSRTHIDTCVQLLYKCTCLVEDAVARKLISIDSLIQDYHFGARFTNRTVNTSFRIKAVG